MDPFSALAIATSAVQFIDFASKLVSKANEIRKYGSEENVELLKAQTADLVARNEGLRACVRQGENNTGEMDRVEQV